MMNKIIQFFKKYRWAFLSGVLVGTSYIPLPPWALFFGFTPIWLHIVKNNLSPKESFQQLWVTQFTLTLIGFHWIAYLVNEFGQLPWVVAILALLLFSSLVHLYIPISIGIIRKITIYWKLSPLFQLLVIAISHSLIERVWPSIFPWNLGYPLLGSKIPLYHWADVIGFEGLATLVLLIQAFIGYLWLEHQNRNKILKPAMGGILIFIGLNVAGHFKSQIWKSTDSEFKASAIQANIGNLDKAYAEQGKNVHSFIINKFLNLSLEEVQKSPNTDLIIWPETAFPDFVLLDNENSAYRHWLNDGLSKIQKPLLTGAFSKDPYIPGSLGKNRKDYNAVVLLDQQGKLTQKAYHKTHLLLFGEYIPFEEYLQWFAKMIAFSSSFGKGTGPSLQILTRSPTDFVKMGIQICYEGLYPPFSIDLSKLGAQILINHTNDSWFGYPFEPRQHMYMTLARAIETRRPMIRVTNTGISTAILASGEILQKSPTHVEWTGTFNIPFNSHPEQTFFVLWGHFDYIIWIILLLILLAIGKKHAKSEHVGLE